MKLMQQTGTEKLLISKQKEDFLPRKYPRLFIFKQNMVLS